jgi:hypothetical protein
MTLQPLDNTDTEELNSPLNSDKHAGADLKLKDETEFGHKSSCYISGGDV